MQRKTVVLQIAALALAALAGAVTEEVGMEEVTFRKLSPILIVDSVETVLPFWERIGFSRTVEVPHGDGLGFVILVRDGVEVMLQSRASVADDLPPLAADSYRSTLYIEVSDVRAVAQRLAPEEIVVPLRSTFYGALEVFAREPGGSLVGFAERVDGDGD